MKFIALILFLQIYGCSFKPQDKDSKTSIDKSLLDSDGDGLSDAVDSNPYLADIPVFEGEMLEEIKIKTKFYNRPLNLFKETEMMVKSDDENAVVKKGMGLVRSLAENEAAIRSLNDDFISLNISSNQLDFYTAPVITDGVAHNFRAQSSDLENQGYFLDSVEFEIRNRINLKSERFKNYRDIIFDVFFYDYQSKKIEFIDSFKNVGSFEFNKDHLLDITNIQTRNTRIMDNSVLKSGKFLYVKIKDFYIPDLKLNYSDLMQEVRKNTIPVVINAPKDYKVFYVGTSGHPSSLIQLFKTSLKNEFEIDNNRFIKYRDFPVGEYRVDDGSGQRQTITSKWHILTNDINNNPFSYTFLPKDIVFLNYTKSDDPIFLPTNVANTFSETKKELVLKGEGFYPAKVRKIKIILSSLTYIKPTLISRFIQRNTCSQSGGIYGGVKYKNVRVDYIPKAITPEDEAFELLLSNTFVMIDGFRYSLKELITDGKFTFSIDSENKISFESTDVFIKNLKPFGSEMAHISLVHQPSVILYEVGEKIVECRCAVVGAGGATSIGCQGVTRLGAVKNEVFDQDYTFYTSLFIF